MNVRAHALTHNTCDKQIKRFLNEKFNGFLHGFYFGFDHFTKICCCCCCLLLCFKTNIKQWTAWSEEPICLDARLKHNWSRLARATGKIARVDFHYAMISFHLYWFTTWDWALCFVCLPLYRFFFCFVVFVFYGERSLHPCSAAMSSKETYRQTYKLGVTMIAMIYKIADNSINQASNCADRQRIETKLRFLMARRFYIVIVEIIIVYLYFNFSRTSFQLWFFYLTLLK